MYHDERNLKTSAVWQNYYFLHSNSKQARTGNLKDQIRNEMNFKNAASVQMIKN